MPATVPPHYEFMNPILTGLRSLGGSATNHELYEYVAQTMGLSEEQLELVHDPEKGNQTEVAYRMAWARTYLKKAGYIDNSKRAVWSLTAHGRDVEKVDERKINREVQQEDMAQRARRKEVEESAAKATGLSLAADGDDSMLAYITGESWRDELLSAVKNIAPDAFERLCQRILRESGFVEVEVTGKSGDGGIDGIGILRLGGLLSFPVLFQCKRYQGSVPSREIRDFRGAMAGRSDKGLFITTGTFTRDAQKEATRDGAPPIDLIDGNQLVDLLQKLGLGVTTHTVEVVEVVHTWFEGV